MHRFDLGMAPLFELETLEIRRFLTTASVNASHVLNIVGTSAAETIFVNRLSNGKVSITGVSTQFKPGSGAGQFNKINIDAGGGNDRVTISNNVPYGSSTVSGGGGNDTTTGGKGNDSIGGGEGNDSIDGGGEGADKLVGNAGFDTANYSYRTEDLKITLDGLANDGANGGAEHDNVQTEEVFSGTGDDVITGSSNDDFLSGGAGDDDIRGMGGNDEIIGATGADQILGNDGDDFLQAKNQDRDTVNGGANSDGSADFDLASVDSIDVPGPITAARAASAAAAAGGDSPFGVEMFITDDQLSGQEEFGPLAEHFADLSVAAVWFTRAQPNTQGVGTINLGNANNTIIFKSLNVDGQPLLGLTVNGVLLTYDPETTTQIVINTGSGNDLIEANDRVRVPLLIHTGEGNDTVTGGARRDIIFGEEGDDVLSGGRRADILLGGQGKDSLFGGDARDILIGGDDADNLYGERGEDILIGAFTIHDDDVEALTAIQNEWISTDSNADRIKHLRNGGGLNGKFLLNADVNGTPTVFPDKGGNFLNGGADRDWFFKADTDTIKQGPGEEVDQVVEVQERNAHVFS